MISIEQARLAKTALRSQLRRPSWLRGIGIGRDYTGYFVKVNVAGQRASTKVPARLLGVPVHVAVTGKNIPLSYSKKLAALTRNPLGQNQDESAFVYSYYLITVLGGAAGAYHGYKRNEAGKHPLAWAVWWFFWGGLVPIITIPIALAQGFGQPE